MSKKVISILTAIVMAVSLAGVLPAVTVGAETSGDYEYTVLDDGTVEITGYTGSEAEIEIPSEIDGKDVTSIGDSVFYGSYSLINIIIPNSVISIGDNAFFCCHSLKNITIPDSVTSIGWSAFSSCESLINIDVDSNNKNYSSQDGVLFNYDKTELIQYPIGKTQTSYTIPNSITSIGYDAFSYCDSLTSVTIPDSVTSIEDWAFNACYSLTEINVDANNKNYLSQDGVLFNKSETDLVKYPAGKTQTSYTIPNSITSIGYDAFSYCDSLTSITIPDSVTSIGDRAFSYCYSLTSITIPDSVTNIGDDVFCYCYSIISVTVPKSVTSIGDMEFMGCNSLTSITIPDSVTSIGYGAFYDCNNLKSVTIPKSVTKIGDRAFGYYWKYDELIDDTSIAKVDNFKIYCYAGTAGEQYAKDNGFNYELLNDKVNQSQTPNNNSNKPNKTVSPTNNKKTTPSTNKVTVTKPAKVKSVKLTAKKKKLNVKWKKVSGATGYEVIYAKNNKFTKNKKSVTVKKNKVTLKRLKSKKKYFVKVRAYKTVNGNTSYGKWSKVVKKKVK